MSRDIKYARERLVIAELRIELSREYARAYSSGIPLSEHLEIELVGTTVFIGDVRGRPMTASAISRHVGMPRPTVLRRLDTLIRREMVVREGRHYRVGPAGIDGPHLVRMTLKNSERIQAAARILSKLDENRAPG